MALWHEAQDALTAAERLKPAQDRTGDDWLRIAEVKALLAIGQELSIIHHEGIAEYRK